MKKLDVSLFDKDGRKIINDLQDIEASMKLFFQWVHTGDTRYRDEFIKRALQ